MKDFNVQFAYKDTDGRLKIAERVFESESKNQVLVDALQIFLQIHPFVQGDGYLIAAKELSRSDRSVVSGSGRSVAIGGSIANTTIITGSGNFCG